VICLEFLQYYHSGRCLSLYVVKVAMKPSVMWESRAVGQALKRSLYAVEPAFQPGVTFSEIRCG